MSTDGELKLDLEELEDFSKLICADTVAANLFTHTRLCLNCQEIELNTNNVKIVLDNDDYLKDIEI